jgi:hydroxyacylglutathione hydrolase
MIQIKSFTFNPFQENTYILINENNECIIIDPGMYSASEQMELDSYITSNNLKPVMLINTHCHIDHIFGNNYCVNKYHLQLQSHEKEIEVLNSGLFTAKSYGLNYDPSPQIELFLKENQTIKFGDSTLKVLFTPGHSPGSISLYSEENHFVIVGDALFYQSIGRTDLPGGNHQTLIQSIESQLMTLPDKTSVMSGHGPMTNIGHERQFNPFLND